MRIELYGVLREVAATHEVELHITEAVTVDAVLERLAAEHPPLAPHLPRVAVALGDELVDRDTQVPPGTVLALLPPVSGGTARTETKAPG